MGQFWLGFLAGLLGQVMAFGIIYAVKWIVQSPGGI